jgi:CRP-like cAMP-binding protein
MTTVEGWMGIEDDITVLERVPTFSVLGRDALRILAIGAENRAVPQGEVLFSVGDAADAGFIIQRGAFTLKEGPPDSEGEVATARGGTLLGEFALLTETTRPMSAVAAEPSTVLRIPRTLFLKMLEGYPEAAVRLRGFLAERTTRAASEIVRVGAEIKPKARR